MNEELHTPEHLRRAAVVLDGWPSETNDLIADLLRWGADEIDRLRAEATP